MLTFYLSNIYSDKVLTYYLTSSLTCYLTVFLASYLTLDIMFDVCSIWHSFLA